jgi:hypothetical protein
MWSLRLQGEWFRKVVVKWTNVEGEKKKKVMFLLSGDEAMDGQSVVLSAETTNLLHLKWGRKSWLETEPKATKDKACMSLTQVLSLSLTFLGTI